RRLRRPRPFPYTPLFRSLTVARTSLFGPNSLFGPVDPAVDAGYEEPPPRKGFFTDTSVCIGCKACEVACKEWNLIPGGEDLDLRSEEHTSELQSRENLVC